MTAATSAAIDLPIDTIVLRAYQLAGLLDHSASSAGPTWVSKASMARDFLELDLQGLQARGYLVRSLEFYPLLLVAGTNPYDLPPDTFDVIGTATFLPLGSTTGQTQIAMLDYYGYQKISDKQSFGIPTLFYPHRAATFQLFFWPVPNASSLGTVTLQRRRILATMREGDKTVDCEAAWNEYFLYSLAHKLAIANMLPSTQIQELRGMKLDSFANARNFGRQRASTTIISTHSGGAHARRGGH
jgi:hypothetical protein